MRPSYSVVVPTLGHPRLGLLVASVRETTARGQDPLDVLVIDDRPFEVPDDAGPDVVEPLPGARRVLRGLRADGMFVGVVWDRTDAGCGHLTVAQADTVGREMRRVLGRVDTWQLCTHARTEGCTCREPEAGLVLRAAAELGVLPAECAVVGDVRDGIGAAVTAGARSIVLPTDAGWA